MQKIIFSLLFLASFFISNAQTDSAKTLTDVVVTGQYQPQSLRNSVYSVRVIREKLRQGGVTTVGEVLNTELGFRFTNDRALGISDVQLNGMSGRNVKLLLDGVPVPDRFDERVSISQIDVNTIDRIEVVEGPMSVSYGSDAMAGTINIITKRNRSKDLHINVRVQEESAGEEYYPFSFQGRHLQSLDVSKSWKRWNASAGGSHVDFNGFGGDAFGRQKSWLPKEQYFGNAKFGYSVPGFDIYFRVDGLDEKLIDRNEIFVDPDVPRAIATDQEFKTKRWMHQLQSNALLRRSLTLNSYLALSNLQRTSHTIIRDFIAQTESDSKLPGTQDVSNLFSLGFKNTLSWVVSEKISIQPGIDINYEKANGQRIAGEPEITDGAIFASAEFKLNDKINIRPGLRFISNSVYDAPAVVPALNTKFNLKHDLDLRFAYGYGFRAPTLRELYFTFVDANHNIKGNTQLKAETSNSFTASLTKTLIKGKSSFTPVLATFYNDFQNQIDIAENASVAGEFIYVNVNETKTAGGSLNIAFSRNALQAAAGAQVTGYNREYNDADYKDDDRDFLWSPEANASISYRAEKIKMSFGLFYKYTGKRPVFVYQSSGTRPGLYVSETDAYHIADINISKTFLKYFTANAGVKNLFDIRDVQNTRLQSNGVHGNNGVLSVNCGRSAFLGLQFNF